MKPTDSFYDNSSEALGIGYHPERIRIGDKLDDAIRSGDVRLSPKALEASFEADPDPPVECLTCHQNRKTCGCLSKAEEKLNEERIRQLRKLEITDITQVEPFNKGAYSDVEERTRELFAEGSSLLEATDAALNERPDPVHVQPAEEQERVDYLGASVESLMTASVKPTGGGGGGSKGREKTFPKRCIYPECSLQYCDHPKSASKRGRPALPDGEGKTERIRGQITPAAKAGFEKAGITPNHAMQILGIALLEGRTFEDVRVTFAPATIPGDAA